MTHFKWIGNLFLPKDRKRGFCLDFARGITYPSLLDPLLDHSSTGRSTVSYFILKSKGKQSSFICTNCCSCCYTLATLMSPWYEATFSSWSVRNKHWETHVSTVKETCEQHELSGLMMIWSICQLDWSNIIFKMWFWSHFMWRLEFGSIFLGHRLDLTEQPLLFYLLIWTEMSEMFSVSISIFMHIFLSGFVCKTSLDCTLQLSQIAFLWTKIPEFWKRHYYIY